MKTDIQVQGPAQVNIHNALDSLTLAHQWATGQSSRMPNGKVVSIADVASSSASNAQTVYFTTANTARSDLVSASIDQRSSGITENTVPYFQPSDQYQSLDFEILEALPVVNNGGATCAQHDTRVVLNRLQHLHGQVKGADVETQINYLKSDEGPEWIPQGACPNSLVYLETTEIKDVAEVTWSGYLVNAITSTAETITSAYDVFSSYVPFSKS